MNKKQFSKIAALFFAAFIAFGPASAIVAAGGEAEQPASQTAPQSPPQTAPEKSDTQILPVQQTTQAAQPAVNSGSITLDQSLKEAANQIDERIAAGSKIAPINFSSPSDNFSSYVLDELTANLVDSRKLTVVDRKEIDLIRNEFKFQFSGDVGDDSMQALGRMLGAQSIITGSLTDMGGFYRIVIRVLNVQNASVEVQYRANIVNDTVVTALLSGGRSGTTTNRTGVTSGATSATSGTNNSASPVETIPDGATVLNVNNVATWNTAVNKIRNGENGQTYVISVTGNVLVPVVAENLFGSVTGITVTIQGGGTLAISNTQGSLLRIGTRQTIIAKNITLKGRSDNNSAVVVIDSGGTFRMENGASVTGNINKSGYGGGVLVNNGGTFTMSGGTISGNTCDGWWNLGGAVYVNGGTFTMSGGTISGNISSSWSGGGGVFVNSGTFTMQGGIISGNTAKNAQSGYGGGGVFVNGGTFTIQGGTISDNVSSSSGGGVCVYNGTFIKTGGTIQGNDEPNRQNSAKEQGHAVYLRNGSRWRNATAGPDDNTSGYGFWLND